MSVEIHMAYAKGRGMNLRQLLTTVRVFPYHTHDRALGHAWARQHVFLRS